MAAQFSRAIVSIFVCNLTGANGCQMLLCVLPTAHIFRWGAFCLLFVQAHQGISPISTGFLPCIASTPKTWKDIFFNLPALSTCPCQASQGHHKPFGFPSSPEVATTATSGLALHRKPSNPSLHCLSVVSRKATSLIRLWLVHLCCGSPTYYLDSVGGITLSWLPYLYGCVCPPPPFWGSYILSPLKLPLSGQLGTGHYQ